MFKKCIVYNNLSYRRMFQTSTNKTFSIIIKHKNRLEDDSLL